MSQFCTDESVNELLTYSKMMVDCITANYAKPDELRVAQYVIFAGLISRYGFEYINEITEAFRNNQFLYTEGRAWDALVAENKTFEDYFSNCNKDLFYALYFPEYFRTTSGRYFSKGKIIVSNYHHLPPDELLEHVTHEVNHAVTSVNSVVTFVNGQMITRIGMGTKNHSTGEKQNKMFDEAVNTLDAADIMEHILSFTNYDIKDQEIKYFLDSISYAANKKRQGLSYSSLTSVVRPLYENKTFNGMLKKGRISGNVEPIINTFNEKVGNYSFRTLAGICDDLGSPWITSSQLVMKQNHGKQLVAQYVSR